MTFMLQDGDRSEEGRLSVSVSFPLPLVVAVASSVSPAIHFGSRVGKGGEKEKEGKRRTQSAEGDARAIGGRRHWSMEFSEPCDTAAAGRPGRRKEGSVAAAAAAPPPSSLGLCITVSLARYMVAPRGKNDLQSPWGGEGTEMGETDSNQVDALSRFSLSLGWNTEFA